MIASHHDNNYVAALKSLNKVREHLAALPSDAPPFVVAGLRERELAFHNSAILHEHDFGNLGGDGRRGDGVEKAMTGTWSGAAAGEAEFRAAAASLPGGHSQTPAGTYPLLVLDMFEHAYPMDHGAAAAKYVDAFFANIKWEVVEARLQKTLRAGAALGA